MEIRDAIYDCARFLHCLRTVSVSPQSVIKYLLENGGIGADVPASKLRTVHH
jgi:hypothetical protein